MDDDLDTGWVDLTEEVRELLKSERLRTAVNFPELLRRQAKLPSGLTRDVINRWLSNQKRASKPQLDFVLNAYAALPSIIMANLPDTTPAKNDVQKTVRDKGQIKRHLTVLRRILSLFSNNTKTLSDTLFEHNGKRYSAHFIGSLATSPNRMVLDAPSMDLIHALQFLPVYADAQAMVRPQFEKPRRIKLNAERLDLLESELNRTGTTLAMLAMQLRSEVPKLRSDTMTGWRTGELKTAKAAHWEAVIGALAARPDANRSKLNTNTAKQLFIPETAPNVKATIRGINDTTTKPDLTFETLPQKRVWQSLRKRKSILDRGQYVEITQDIYDQLHAEVRRTLVSPRRLFAISSDVPAGLRYHTANMWLYHATKSAEPRYISWVFKAYKRLKDV